MSHTFHGPWSVTVKNRPGEFHQRCVIAGSDASDGRYHGLHGVPVIQVTGARWTIELEWNDGTPDSSWYPAPAARELAYLPGDGLVITLRAADQPADVVDFVELEVTCRYLEPTFQPEPTDPDLRFELPLDRGRRPIRLPRRLP